MTAATDPNPLGVPAKRHINPDGTEGGWVADTATVAPTAYIGRDAWVFGDAWVSGNAWVFGNAWVSGDARVSGNASWLHISPMGITATREKSGAIAVAWAGTRMALDEFAADPGRPRKVVGLLRAYFEVDK